MGTASSWSHSFSTGTTLEISFSGKIPLFGGANGTISQAWTQTKETNGSLSVDKGSSLDISVPGPANSNSGIDHNGDIVLVWINPEADFKATSANGALWNDSFDQRDPANEPDVIPVFVAWLKNPASMPVGVQNSLARTWAGSGQGLTTADFATILARDPFANGSTTIDPKRFDLQGGETFAYLPPPCGFQPITETFSEFYNTTTTFGTSASDSYSVSYTKSAGAGFGTWLQANFTATTSLSWTNQWGHQNSSSSGQKATFSITGPSDCHYAGPTDAQVYQDNVYGTFMFAFL